MKPIFTKPITGTWFEFRHHNTKEGKYWNDTLHNFTEEQWRAKIREMKEAGLDQIALLATALKDKAYFKTDIFSDKITNIITDFHFKLAITYFICKFRFDFINTRPCKSNRFIICFLAACIS